MKIVEIKREPHIFTKVNGDSFRIFAGETKTLPDSQISDEMYRAEKMGLIRLIKDSTPTPYERKKATTASTDTKKEQEVHK